MTRILDGTEVRQILRRLGAAPGFTAAAVLTLTLGIGATTALFSVVNAVVLRPLPYSDPDRLIVLWTDDVKRQLHETLVSYPLYRDWKEQSRSFANLGFSSRNSPVTLTGVAVPERLDAARASASMFEILGVSPLEGRTFSAEEERRKDPVAILSQAFAERRYGSARAALGQTLQFDDRAVTVLGVMPRWFQFPAPEIQLWLPLGDDRLRVVVIGRLQDSVTLDDARQELAIIGTALSQRYPDLAANPDFSGFRVRLVPLTQQVTGRDTRIALWLLLGAVMLVLAIACGNVANLLIARASARQRELALRAALGANRWQIVRYLLHEAVILTMVATVLGVVLAVWLVRVVIAIAPRSVPRLDSVTLDGFTLAFTIVVALACALSVGAAAAWHVTRQTLREALEESGRSGDASAGRRRLQRILIVSEFALTLSLVCGSGLLLRSLVEVERVPLGFNPRDILVFRMVVPDALTELQRESFYREASERLRRLPGVSRVGIISNMFTASTPNATVLIEGRPDTARINTPIADDSISPELFATLQVPLRSGRFFTDRDTAASPLVAIVNETFARRFWSGESPIGKRFQFLDERFGDRWVAVAGVVGDMRRNGLEQNPFPQVYLPFAQSPSRGADMVVQTSTTPLTLTLSAYETIAAINPAVPVYQISTLDQRIDTLLATRRFQVLMLSLFAVAGLVLAAVGIYGLMRYTVAQRTREIGVRVAIGATRGQVMTLVLREGLALTGVGLVAGLVVAFALTRALRTLLYGITPSDPLTFLFAPAVLVVVAIVACVEPTWRAMRVDPARVLRSG